LIDRPRYGDRIKSEILCDTLWAELSALCGWTLRVCMNIVRAKKKKKKVLSHIKWRTNDDRSPLPKKEHEVSKYTHKFHTTVVFHSF
jgi:hypothetical protein